jgi:hypothetical protein
MRKRKKAAQLHGKIVDWAEHVFEEGMMYVRVRFTDGTVLDVAVGARTQGIRPQRLETGDKQLKIYPENEIDWPE